EKRRSPLYYPFQCGRPPPAKGNECIESSRQAQSREMVPWRVSALFPTAIPAQLYLDGLSAFRV
ncbi:MAG: hypothetical protein FWB91_10990, partial [Defluviitaleaceae bacterium]|nr:hypothetical protein [Defluviitaleaceae bacterium]